MYWYHNEIIKYFNWTQTYQAEITKITEDETELKFNNDV